MTDSIKFKNREKSVLKSLSVGGVSHESRDEHGKPITELEIDELGITVDGRELYEVGGIDISMIDIVKAVCDTRLAFADPDKIAEALNREVQVLVDRVYKYTGQKSK